MKFRKKTIWCNIRKGYFVWRKEIFERVRLTTGKRKKKTKPEGEEKKRSFTVMKKENEKSD